MPRTTSTTVHAYKGLTGTGEEPDSFGPFESRHQAESLVVAIATKYRRIEMISTEVVEGQSGDSDR